MGHMIIATWNMKQAVAPKKPLNELWAWIENEIDPDIIVLTEARPPKEIDHDKWGMIYKPGGIGPRRTWGTIVAARKPIELVKAEFKVNAFDEAEWATPAPGSVESVDIVLEGKTWATVVGVYAFMPNSKNGFEALDGIICEVIDVMASDRERVIVAGDFNLWPNDLNRFMNDLPLIDVIGTVDGFPELVDGKGGSRIWTHKNGNSPNAARQEIDFIYVSEAMVDEFVTGGGGIDDYPISWEFSDHAPVVVQLKVD